MPLWRSYCFLWFLVYLTHQIYAHLNIEDLSELELMHIFGTNDIASDSLQFDTVSLHKNRTRNGLWSLSLTYFGDTYEFDLKPVTWHDENQGGECTFFGDSIFHPGSSIALVDCTGHMRGMILTESGEVLFLHPVPPSAERGSSALHVVHKRDAINPVTINSLLLRSETSKNAATIRNRQVNGSEFAAVIRGPLTVEVALFADEKLWRHFEHIYGREDAENELRSFVLASVNNVNLLYNHRTFEPKLQLKIKRYSILKNGPDSLSDSAHANGDVDILLDNFCRYQNSFNAISDDDSSHWDHALLFTGYDLYRGELKTVAGMDSFLKPTNTHEWDCTYFVGYAPVKGMCSGVRSCTINEGLDFGSVFVIAHEMGHSLGMFHDGDNGCDAGCCIMSPSVGSGKTSWSQCSIREFNDFLNQLGSDSWSPNCLLDGGSEIAFVDYSLRGDYPGQRYNLDQQCRFFHGSCWRQELREGESTRDVCNMVWCGEGEGIIRTAHPALEGTYCGDNRWCIQGKCSSWPENNVRPQPIHGAWSAWNDAPNDGCGVNCDAPCKVDGQIMIRRSVRLCENPAPNNGGNACRGSMYRGFICSDTACRGERPNEHATDVCTSLRDGTGPAGPAALQLTGRGFQHQEQPCRIWCQLLAGNYARAVGNFPDGTPCGIGHYCIRGECMMRSCGGQWLVKTESECPNTQTNSNFGQPLWSQWSPWSECSITCGYNGRRQRTRVCSTATCSGPATELEPCNANVECRSFSNSHANTRFFLKTPDNWGGWSACDATCGQGMRRRRRRCRETPCSESDVDSQICQLAPCPSVVVQHWNSWSDWSPCSMTCGYGTQQRRRLCNGSVPCYGRKTATRRCSLSICAQPTSPGIWSQWSSWSLCSKDCLAGGLKFRQRTCEGAHCMGSHVAFGKCSAVECERNSLSGE